MPPAPKRHERRIPHLGAHIVPVERALNARAQKLEDQSRETDGGNSTYLLIAAEFRDLAEELHFW